MNITRNSAAAPLSVLGSPLCPGTYGLSCATKTIAGTVSCAGWEVPTKEGNLETRFGANQDLGLFSPEEVF